PPEAPCTAADGPGAEADPGDLHAGAAQRAFCNHVALPVLVCLVPFADPAFGPPFQPTRPQHLHARQARQAPGRSPFWPGGTRVAQRHDPVRPHAHVRTDPAQAAGAVRVPRRAGRPPGLPPAGPPAAAALTTGMDPGPHDLIRPGVSLTELAAAVQQCRGCDLWRDATQAVFGEGSPGSPVVLVGEQPGDAEDRRGHPFVGPAGLMLRRCMAEAGLAE